MMTTMKTPEQIARDFIAREIRFGRVTRYVSLTEGYLRGLIERAIEADRAQRPVVTDEMADAANQAHHAYAWGGEPLSRRDLGITRQAWKAALRAALGVEAE